MSPPLAGSMKMRLVDFLQFDGLGAALLHRRLHRLPDISSATPFAPSPADCAPPALPPKSISGIGLAVYIVYRIWIYRKYRLLDVIPRIPAEELAKTISLRCRPEHAHRRRPQPRLLRRRLRAHRRIHPHRTQQPRSKKSRTSPRIARFISTALERAKPPAPVWRANYRILDSKSSSSPEACAPGAKPDTPSSAFPTTTWSSCQLSTNEDRRSSPSDSEFHPAFPPAIAALDTVATFRKCFEHVFTVVGFDEIGSAELQVEAVTGSIGETIWVESESWN